MQRLPKRPKEPEKVHSVNNPDGIFSGMTKRLAISDGAHVEMGNLPTEAVTGTPLKRGRLK
jgi:hypothetical protein